MKKLYIVDNNRHLSFSTPADVDGEQLRDLETYHVKTNQGKEVTVSKKDIILYWLVDLTTGAFEGWSHQPDAPEGGIMPFDANTLSIQQEMEELNSGIIIDKPDMKNINYSIVLQMKHYFDQMGNNISVGEIYEQMLDKGVINSDGTPTKWAIDNGYITHGFSSPDTVI